METYGQPRLNQNLIINDTVLISVQRYFDHFAIILFYFREQRQKYYYNKGKAKMEPLKYMSIIIDGMDQAKLMIPNLLHSSKAFADAWKLRTHMTGCLNHGHEPLCVLDLFQWPHDSNYSINVLLIMLMRHEYVPDVLFLQMDNCFRENKNQFLFTFIAILVQKLVFKKVSIIILKTFAFQSHLQGERSLIFCYSIVVTALIQ